MTLMDRIIGATVGVMAVYALIFIALTILSFVMQLGMAILF